MSHGPEPTKSHVRAHLSEAKRKIREAEVAFEHGARRAGSDPGGPARARARAEAATFHAILQAQAVYEAMRRWHLHMAEVDG